MRFKLIGHATSSLSLGLDSKSITCSSSCDGGRLVFLYKKGLNKGRIHTQNAKHGWEEMQQVAEDPYCILA